MIRNNRSLIVGLAVFSLLGSRAFAATLGFSISPQRSAHAPRVDVLDDSTWQPIGDAKVTIAPDSTITVTHPGYAAVTLIGAKTGHVTIYLKKLLPRTTEDPIASGTMGDYEVPEDGSTIHVGLVYRALSTYDLLEFQMSKVVSPLKDTIHVFGTRNIPSNIVLPKQTVDLIGSIDLDKPNYRLPIPRDTPILLTGIQGSVPTSEIESLVTSGYSATILNGFTFDHVGFTQPFTANGNMTQDVPAPTELVPGIDATTAASPYSADIILAAVADLHGDREVLIPTDLKAIPASRSRDGQSVSLRVAQSPIGTSEGVVAVAMGNQGQRLSGVISEVSGSSVSLGDFLNADDLKDFTTFPSSVTLSRPNDGVGMIAFQADETASHGKTPVWYVYTLPSAGSVTVSSQNNPTSETLSSYAITQLDFGSAFSENSIDGTTIMTQLSRFTRSAAEKAKN